MAGLFDDLIPGDPAASGAPAPAPSSGMFDDLIPGPKRQVGLGERLFINVGEGFEKSTTGQVIDQVQSGRVAERNAAQMGEVVTEARNAGSPVGLDLLRAGQRGATPSPYATIPIDEIERMQADTLASSAGKAFEFSVAEDQRRKARDIAPWIQAGDGGVIDAGLAGGAALLGQVIGGLPAVENVVPVSRGARAVDTFVRGAKAGGTGAAIAEPFVQGSEIDLGRKKEMSPEEAALSVGVGALTGGALNAAPQAARSLGDAFRREPAPAPAAAPAPAPEPAPAQIPFLPRIAEDAVPNEAAVAHGQRILDVGNAANERAATPPRPPEPGEAPSAREAPGTAFAQRPENPPFAETADIARDRRVAGEAAIVREQFGVPEEQFAQMPVDARERLVAAAQRQKSSEAPAEGVLRTSDDALADGEARYSPAEPPNRNLGEDVQLRGEEVGGINASDRVASGGSSRPFPDDPTTRGFEETARADSERMRAETVEDLERGWQRRRDERDAGAEEAYAGAKAGTFSNKPGKQDADGRFATDNFGLVKSDKGGPIRFGDQKQAARWILNQGHKLSPDQTFEIVNHPKGGFSVRERGRTPPPQPPPGGTGPGSFSPPARVDPASPRAANPMPTREALRAETVVREEGPMPLDPRADVEAAPRVLPQTKTVTRGKSTYELTTKPSATPYKPEPQRPPTLADMVRQRGVAPVDLDQVAHIFGDRKAAGLAVGRRDGQQLDYLCEAAVEQGYLPEGATLNDFIDALDRDVRARGAGSQEARVYSQNDVELLDAWQATREYNDEVSRLARDFGVDEAGLTPEAFERIIAERMGFEEQARISREIGEARARDLDEAARLEDLEAARAESTLDPDAAAYLEGGAGRAEPQGNGAAAGKPADVGGGQADVPPGDRGRSDPGAAQARDGAEQRGGQAERGTGDGDAQHTLDVGGTTEAKPLSSTREKLEASQLGRKGSTTQQEAPTGGLFGRVKDLFQDKSGGPSEKWVLKYTEALEDFIADIKDIRDARRARKADENLVRSIVYSADGWIRSIAKKHTSPALNRVLDQFHARAGQPGGVARTFDEAVHIRINQRLTALETALGSIGEDKAAMAQVVKLVQEPANIRPGTPVHDAAAAIKKLLSEELDYLRTAGVDVGQVRGGYFPRMVEKMAVLRNPTGFMAAAERAFRAEGVADPRAAAKEWHDRITLGDGNPASIFLPVAGDAQAAFLKGRVLGKRADEIMRAFMIQDPRVALTRYVTQATRRAELARRFGDGWSKWGDIEAQIKREGAETAIPALRDYVRTVAGLTPPGTTPGMLTAMSWARTWGTLGYLEKATLSSLGEWILPAMRTGNLGDAARSLRTTIAETVNRARGQTSQLRALAEDLGAIASGHNDTIMAARFGHDATSQFQAKLMHKFFRRTYLEQWTTDTRVASVGVGQTFLRRLATEMEGGGTAVTKRYLAELGVPIDQADVFAGWLRRTNGGRPQGADLAGPMGDIYRTAINRFVDQTIMRPSAATKPKWASHWLGSVVFQLQSYQYAFTRNVLGRIGNNARAALTDADLTMLDRARLLAPIASLPLLVGMNAAVGELRDTATDSAQRAVGGEPNKRANQTPGEKAAKIASRSGLFGNLDPYINAFAGVRYNAPIASKALGPVLGGGVNALQTLAEAGARNSPNTNTAERKVAKQAYDTVVEPAVNLALGALPGASIPAAILTQIAGSGAPREALTSVVAGPAVPKGGAGVSSRGTARGTGRGSR